MPFFKRDDACYLVAVAATSFMAGLSKLMPDAHISTLDPEHVLKCEKAGNSSE